MSDKKRKVVVMVGSDSDLPQCKEGLNYLRKMQEDGLVEVLDIYTASIHRNTMEVLRILQALSEEKVDVLIAGAGWANHLTGTCDAFLRNKLKDRKLVVVGVAFVDGKNSMHTIAASSGISEVPGTQVVFQEFRGGPGFLRACKFAAEGDLPEITLKEPKPTIRRSLDETINHIKKRETTCATTA